MRTIILLAVGLIYTGAVQAPARNAPATTSQMLAGAGGQVGSSISSDGSAPNTNAMLDVQSPSTGDGKGILIPRVTGNQRTNANASLAGGLLDGSGNLRGGAAQGLIVYQTDGSQGLYFNTSQAATPSWVYLGQTDSVTNYLPRTGGTMSGALNMGEQFITNVAHIDFNGDIVSVGRGANSYYYGAAIGYLADGTNYGAAMGWAARGSDGGAAMGSSANGYNGSAAVGYQANGASVGAAVGYEAYGYDHGAAMGYQAKGYNYGVAVGYQAKGTNYGAAIGSSANGSFTGVAVGVSANGYNNGAAVGREANGAIYGAAVGRAANGSDYGVALGWAAKGTNYGVAVGRDANGSVLGAAVGESANGYNNGAAVGYEANGYSAGAAMGYTAKGTNYGVAVGREANGNNFGAAVGYYANGVRTNVAIGVEATALGGTERIAIGHYVTNEVNNSAVIRGTLYLDGGTGVNYRATFGSGAWANKAFTIDHPLDPENKVLRHFCLEGPQVWNVYAGNVQLVNGQAVVELPDYYSALNLVGSEIYGLTPLGDAFVWIVAKVSDNRFIIAGKQDIEVSWTIKVLRNDPGCLEDLRRHPVEQMKSEIR